MTMLMGLERPIKDGSTHDTVCSRCARITPHLFEEVRSPMLTITKDGLARVTYHFHGTCQECGNVAHLLDVHHPTTGAAPPGAPPAR